MSDEATQAVQEQAPALEEKLSDMDRLALEVIKSKEAAARAQFESAALATRNAVLQLFMKYKLTEADLIKEDGTIVRGGATQVTAQ